MKKNSKQRKKNFLKFPNKSIQTQYLDQAAIKIYKIKIQNLKIGNQTIKKIKIKMIKNYKDKKKK